MMFTECGQSVPADFYDDGPTLSHPAKHQMEADIFDEEANYRFCPGIRHIVSGFSDIFNVKWATYWAGMSYYLPYFIISIY